MGKEESEYPEPSREAIEAAIADFFRRKRDRFERWKIGSIGDDHIDCPKCGRHRSICSQYNSWKCPYFDCQFVFPEDLAPPSLQEIEEIFKLEKRMSWLKWVQKLEKL